MDDPALHPDLTPLAGLVGTWRGAGTGDYPTGAAFAYDEEITFAHLGTPVLSYVQRTRHPESGRPMHAEQGYWRPVPPDRLEAVIAHAVGIVEVQEGTVDGGRIELRSSAVTRTATAKEVDVIERSFRLDGTRSPTRCGWPRWASRSARTWSPSSTGSSRRRPPGSLPACPAAARSPS